MQRCEKLAPREAISAFLAEIVKRSLEDRQPRFAAAMMVLGSIVQTNGFLGIFSLLRVRARERVVSISELVWSCYSKHIDQERLAREANKKRT